MGIGYRPRGESGALYHPDRDYAYITPTLMRAAIDRLTSDQLSEEAKAWKQEHNITNEELGAVADALARAQRDFVNGADPVTSLDQARARRDWFDIRYPVRQFLFAVIGEVFCAAWFTAVREVTRVNEESPAAQQMADFTASARRFASCGASEALAFTRAADLQLRNDVLQSRLETVYAAVLKRDQAREAVQSAPPIEVKKSWWSWLNSAGSK